MLLVITTKRDTTMERVTNLVNKPVMRLDIDEKPFPDLT